MQDLERLDSSDSRDKKPLKEGYVDLDINMNTNYWPNDNSNTVKLHESRSNHGKKDKLRNTNLFKKNYNNKMSMKMKTARCNYFG